MSDLSQGGVTAGGVQAAAPVPAVPTTTERPAPEAHDGTAVMAAQVAEAEGVPREFPIRDRVFHLVPKLPGITLMKMGVAGDPSIGPARQMSAILDFLHVALVEDEREAFMHFLEHDAKPVIEVEELNELIGKMAEVFTGRPT
jgi:hypothetical protein